LLGEHTDEILEFAGYSAEEIAAALNTAVTQDPALSAAHVRFGVEGSRKLAQ